MTGSRSRTYTSLSNEDNNIGGGGGNEVQEEHSHMMAHMASAGQPPAPAPAPDGADVAVAEKEQLIVDKIRRPRRRSFVLGRGRNLLNKVFAKKRRSGSRSSTSDGKAIEGNSNNEQEDANDASSTGGGVETVRQ